MAFYGQAGPSKTDACTGLPGKAKDTVFAEENRPHFRDCLALESSNGPANSSPLLLRSHLSFCVPDRTFFNFKASKSVAPAFPYCK